MCKVFARAKTRTTKAGAWGLGGAKGG